MTKDLYVPEDKAKELLMMVYENAGYPIAGNKLITTVEAANIKRKGERLFWTQALSVFISTALMTLIAILFLMLLIKK
ncbi:MAG: hypothetical protein J7623_20400 [Chitinophaga sp.]|uniref:hypothetical protein n=1 Tax=Chitinophaga sp. TaxID=1869181 RepID=UPI001B0A9B64|nr:hypothetical protein [Chitinophaga sp.]MBO9731013.1 hypothetical protein [Chitinophaga sp.]